MRKAIETGVLLLSLCLLGACSKAAWNNPHPPETGEDNVYYSVIYAQPPKHLDPALSYASDESLYLDQISELLEDRTKLWAGIESASFLTTREKRLMLGFPAEMDA